MRIIIFKINIMCYVIKISGFFFNAQISIFKFQNRVAPSLMN